MFGGSGCLDKDIARGKIVIPTEAYRDEGTSYHYVPAADYITLKNSHVVAGFYETGRYSVCSWENMDYRCHLPGNKR